MHLGAYYERNNNYISSNITYFSINDYVICVFFFKHKSIKSIHLCIENHNSHNNTSIIANSEGGVKKLYFSYFSNRFTKYLSTHLEHEYKLKGGRETIAGSKWIRHCSLLPSLNILSIEWLIHKWHKYIFRTSTLKIC